MAKKSAKVTKVQSTEVTKVVTTNVVEFNDMVLNKVRSEKKALVRSQKDFRKELATNVAELERMYNEDYQGAKAKFDFLCNISGCQVSDFFNVDFVKSLYKTYTFEVVGTGNGVRTLIAEERTQSEKTDFVKLAERAANCPFIGVSLNIAASKFVSGKKPKYWLPVFNFTASNILAHLLSLDAYTLGVAAYKKAKKAEAAKTKKAAKKAAKKADAAKVEESK